MILLPSRNTLGYLYNSSRWRAESSALGLDLQSAIRPCNRARASALPLRLCLTFARRDDHSPMRAAWGTIGALRRTIGELLPNG